MRGTLKAAQSSSKAKSGITQAERISQVKRFEKYVSKHRITLPKGFRFDREEANRR
jgi:hypothetical protein